MNKTTEWKVAGWVMSIVGMVFLISGRAGFTYYGYAEGQGARVVGVLMVIIGLSLAFPRASRKD